MVFSNNLLLGAGGQSTGQAPFDTTLIGNSVWLNGSDTFFKRDNFALSADGRKEFIFSMWIQRNEFGRAQTHFDLYPTGSTSYNDGSRFTFPADDQLAFSVGAGGSSGGQKHTTAVYRDIGWYHVLISYNTNTSVTAASRHRLFVNGLEITDTSTYTAPPDNQSCIGSGTGNADLRIGKTEHPGIPYVPDAYYAQACYLEGKSFQAGDYAITDFLDSFTFGTNGSQYVPKADADIAALATTVGGNSFCLDFADSADLGNDISSNANDFTTTSMTSANQTTNTPSLVYPVWNALEASATLSNGNLNARSTTSQLAAQATQSVSSGKFYWEITANSSADQLFGITGEAVSYANRIAATFNYTPTVFFYGTNGNIYQDGSSTTYDSAISVGDVIGIAVDFDAGKIWFAKNNAWLQSGDPANGTSPSATFTVGTFTPSWCAGGASGDRTGATDFGQLGFTYTPPTDFVSLASSNLTAPTYQGIDYFTSTLYEGNGQNQRVGDFVPFTDTFTVSKSAMFDNGDRRYLARTYSAGDTARSGTTCTISYWIKYCSSANNQYVIATSESGQTKRFMIYIDSSGASYLILDPPGSDNNRTFTVPGSFLSEQEWTNFVWQVDPDNATAADKVKAWVNGVQITSTVTTYQSTSASEYYLFDNEEHFVGNLPPASVGYTSFCLNSYLAELNVLDGQLKAPTDFGEVDTSTNRWIPKDYDTNVGTYGNRGFYMEFLNPTGTGNGVGTDSSGNGFNFTESNVSGGSVWATTDQFSDTPSKNFPTFDPTNNGAGTLSEGNTKIVSATDQRTTFTNMTIPATGQWYWEVDVANYVDNGGSYFGLVPASTPLPTNNPANGFTDQIVFQTYSGDSNFYSNTPNGGTAWCNTPGNNAFVADGDVLQFAYDANTGTFFIGRNNTWFRAGGARDSFANATTVAQAKVPTGVARRFIYGRGGSSAETYQLNFGQMANTFSGSSTSFDAASDGFFVYTPPTGYQALNQDNLDDTQSKITALAWIKNRDAADDNIWMDRVIGTGGYLSTTQNDSGSAATTYGDGGTDVLTANTNAVQRFLQRGVQIGSDENVNTANESYVLWQWLLGDSATTGSSITTGSPSLATTGIVSDANHFSIVQYTGNGIDNATFAHGLGSIPNLVMIKRRSGTATNSDWTIHVVGLGTENYIYPHYRIALSVGAGPNGMVPDANLVEIGTGVAVNTSGETHMAYSFKNTPGLCKIGTYTGNSSANGAYVSTGFRPSWLWIFNTTLTSADAERPIIDTARYRFNGATTAGGTNGGINFSDQRAAEEAQTTSLGVNPAIDILSDGFKLRANDSTINTGTTYMYICMADIAGNGTLPPVYGR